MNVLIGVALILIALTALWYMNAAGVFRPFAGIFSDLGAGFTGTFGTSTRPTSAYYQAVRIRFVAVVPGDPPLGEVDLVAHPKTGGITATGWTLKTDKGVFTIPKALNKYSPSTPDVPPENIFLRDGDRIAIYNGEPPEGHVNERVTQSEYHLWFEDFLSSPHGTIVLRDDKGKEVDRYAY